MSEIQRYQTMHRNGEPILFAWDTGPVVLYADHLAAVAAAEQRGRDEVKANLTDPISYEQGQRDALASLVGATEAARILGVSRQRIQQMTDEGKLPTRLVGNALVFTRGEIAAIRGDQP